MDMLERRIRHMEERMADKLGEMIDMVSDLRETLNRIVNEARAKCRELEKEGGK